MKRVVIIAAFFLFMLLTACAKKQELSDGERDIKICPIGMGGNTICKEGYLRDIDGFLCISDYDSGKTVPICSKPNCLHNRRYDHDNENLNCHATYPGIIGGAYIYKHKLYAYCSEGINRTVIFESDLNGENRRVFASFDYRIMSRGVLCDGYFYSTVEYHIFADNSIRPERIDEYIIKVDLNDGRSEVYSLQQIPYYVNLVTVFDEQAIVIFVESDDPNELAEDWDEWIKAVRICSFDMKSGSITCLNPPRTVGVVNPIGNQLYYQLAEGSRYVLYRMDMFRSDLPPERILERDTEIDMTSFSVLDGELLFYDERSDFQKRVAIAGDLDDSWLVGVSSEAGAFIGYGVIRKEDFRNSVDKILLFEEVNLLE